MPEEADRPTLTGPGATDVAAVAAVMRRTAGLPPMAPGISASVRHRSVGTRRPSDSDDGSFAPVVVFSPPHLIRAASEVDQVEALQQQELARLESLRAAVEANNSDSTAATQSELPELEPDAREAVAPTVSLDELVKDLDLALQLNSKDADPVVLRFQALAARMLDEPGAGRNLGLSDAPVEASASHDFSQYVFCRDPSTLLSISIPPGVSVPQDLDVFLSRTQQDIYNAVYGYCQAEQEHQNYFTISYTQYFPGFVQSIFRMFSAKLAGDVYAFYRSLVPGYTNSSGSTLDDVLGVVNWWLIKLCQTPYKLDDVSGSFDDPTLWTSAYGQILAQFKIQFPNYQTTIYIDKGEAGYAFQPYPTSAVNFGLRLVYRQYWRPLGNQVGEIVRTIPLGPKQSEKVSIKTVLTQKSSRSSENSRSEETSSDSSSTAKDSSDTLKEAADRFKWNIDAEAGVNYGVFSAKLSAGMSRETSSNSRDTKSRINESMSKTASRMKTESKVVISTESSRTDEFGRTSEISNPNDEVAVTYVYSKLLRQYALYTELAEVNSVIFVPEQLPPYSEVNGTFVRRHATSIVRVLLNPMYASDVEQMVSEPDNIDLTAVDRSHSADIFNKIAGTANTALGGITAFAGKNLPDFISPVLNAQMTDVSNARAVEVERQKREWRRGSLYDHIRQNILHYMRAIWADEDRDQRWLRYSKIQFPTRWVHDATGSVGGAPTRRDGEYRPDYGPGSMAPLVDVINPSGPIGYAGNYAIYLMTGSPRLANLNEALATVRSPFLQYKTELSAPAGMKVTDAIVYEPVASQCKYTLKMAAAGWTGSMYVEGQTFVVPVNAFRQWIDIDSSLRIVWEGAVPQVGAELVVVVQATGALQDPELQSLRMTNPLPSSANEHLFFSDEVIQQMIIFLPDVAAGLKKKRHWPELTATQQALVRRRYHAFLLVRNSSTRIVLDTNNLVLDLEIGKTPAMESFKRLHRYIDVLKELEERFRRRVENVRRYRRLESGNLADPEIERATLVGSGAELHGIIDGFSDDANTDGAGSTERGGLE